MMVKAKVRCWNTIRKLWSKKIIRTSYQIIHEIEKNEYGIKHICIYYGRNNRSVLIVITKNKKKMEK